MIKCALESNMDRYVCVIKIIKYRNPHGLSTTMIYLNLHWIENIWLKLVYVQHKIKHYSDKKACTNLQI